MLLGEMKQDQKMISEVITQIMWHMRGSLSREEAWTLSPDERSDVMKLIKEHTELTEKTGMPLL